MKKLYLEDSYLKEFTATVQEVNNDKFVVLDKTAFYQKSGGQPHDTGTIRNESGEEFKVVFVGNFDGQISHEIDKPGLKANETVYCMLDWERRHTCMRYHTAMHILTRIIEQETGAKITGNQINLDYGRVDFNLENFNKEQMFSYADKFNAMIKENRPVNTYFLTRDEAMKDPSLFTLENVLPPEVEKIRVVDIENFDKSACGGTHVQNTSEIGSMEIYKVENKGKSNRRLYFRLSNLNNVS